MIGLRFSGRLRKDYKNVGRPWKSGPLGPRKFFEINPGFSPRGRLARGEQHFFGSLLALRPYISLFSRSLLRAGSQRRKIVANRDHRPRIRSACVAIPRSLRSP
jgi:hypothetical protein